MVAVVAKALAVVALAVVVHKVVVALAVVVHKVAVVVHRVAEVVHKVAVPVVADRALRRVDHAVATDNHLKGRTKKSALFYERIA